MSNHLTRPVRQVLAVILSLALLMTFTPLSGIVSLTARAASGDFTEFLDCSSGSATGYFTCNDHFYKVEFTGINTSQTYSVKLGEEFGIFKVCSNGNTYDTVTLYKSADSSDYYTTDLQNFRPGDSSFGYTSNADLVAGASNGNIKQVCTITCVAAEAPTWNWSEDGSSCTATFTCEEHPSLSATLDADITTGSPNIAHLIFNSTSYTVKEYYTQTSHTPHKPKTMKSSRNTAYNQGKVQIVPKERMRYSGKREQKTVQREESCSSVK